MWTIQILLDPNLKSYATDSMMTEFFRKTLSQRPKVESLYLLSCFTMSIDFDRPDACVEIGKWGIEAFPESWRIPMTFPGGTKLLEMIRPSLKNLTPREIDNKNINSNGQ
ncbi:MAG: hypothetical protein NT027_03275 [Proteobacteria bacterium]|nr:hypothetical protein [Pseudomonadota bacterium]